PSAGWRGRGRRGPPAQHGPRDDPARRGTEPRPRSLRALARWRRRAGPPRSPAPGRRLGGRPPYRSTRPRWLLAELSVVAGEMRLHAPDALARQADAAAPPLHPRRGDAA